MDFPRRKLTWTLAIMVAGVLVALLWQGYCGWFLGLAYPYNTFLFVPDSRFSDTAEMMVSSVQPDPYADPQAVYGPFAWLVLRFFSFLPDQLVVIGFFFISVAFLFLLLVELLGPICRTEAGGVVAALALFAFSFPVLICFDRGNAEIVLALLVASAIFLMSRAHYGFAALCLVPAICIKMYPAFLLVLFVRQRKPGWAIVSMVAVGVVTALSLHGLSLSLSSAWESYQRNTINFTRTTILGNLMLENSASPWNAFKVIVASAGKWGLMEPVDFSFNGPFICAAYSVYVGGLGLLAMLLAIYAGVVEKEFARAAMVILLFLSFSVPTGGDYRLLHAEIALVTLITLKSKRAHDWIVLVMLALVMVPKKEIILSYLGKTESGFADVSLNVVLNPVLLLGALFLLVWDGWAHFDRRWSGMRLRMIGRAFMFAGANRRAMNP
jgi:hypothetical protein